MNTGLLTEKLGFYQPCHKPRETSTRQLVKQDQRRVNKTILDGEHVSAETMQNRLSGRGEKTRMAAISHLQGTEPKD